jgi:hypothetical protein
MTTSVPSSLSILDLFSGIGGFSYAAEQLVGGFHTVAFCDTDKACHKVLAKHWPSTPIFPDICELTAADIKPLCPNGLSLITAGFPCQDLSVAGKQAGYDGERSVLFYEIIRLARELRPKFLLLENVRNLLSHQNGETFQETLFQIAKAGYDAEWAVIPASDVGACHRIAFGLLPTPRRGETSDLKSTPGDHFSLSAWARQGQWMLRTPTTGMVNQDRSQDPLYMSKLIAKGQTVTLAAQIKSQEMGLLPTPTAGDSKGRGYFYQRKNGVVVGWNPSLCGAVGAAKVPTALPTLTTRDWKDGSQQACRNTPPNGLLGREIHHVQDSPLTGPPMYLNPSFVEEMMGYPIGWTDLSN